MAKRYVSNEEYNEALKNKDNMALLNSMARKWSHYIDSDDLDSCKQVSLWRALQNHDYNNPSGQKFTTSLYNFMNWECLGIINKKKVPVDKSILVNNLSTSGNFEHVNLFNCINMLQEEERELINFRFFDNMTLDEISKIKNCSIETARKRVLNAIENLKVLMTGDNNE